MVAVCFPFSTDIPVGGGHPSAMLLMQGLKARGIRPVLALHGPDGPAGRWLAEQGAAFQQVRFPGYAGGLARNAPRDLAFILARSRALARFLRAEGIKIVHANDIWMAMTWALACKLAGVKLVWHHRSVARYKLAHRLAFLAADQMIAVSPFAAGRRAGHPKCSVIANPFVGSGERLDRDQVRRDLLAELKLEDSTRLLGFFANLNRPISRRKRPQLVVEALSRLKTQAPDQAFAALFFGTITEPFAAEIKASAQALGVEDQVHLMGFRSPPDAYLLASDVIVAPAVDEGFGRVPIEAMLLGTPVVASNAGNHPALIQDGVTGALVPPDDPALLADAILPMVNDPEYRARIVENAEAEARARFGLAASARAVSSLYTRLLADGLADTRKVGTGEGDLVAPRA